MEDFQTFPKFSEDFLTLSEVCPKFIWMFPIIIPKFSEDVQRLPKVAKYFQAILEDVSMIYM